MAIFYNNKEIIQVSYGGRDITAIYKGSRLVWQSIRSCFGAGYFVPEKPWLGEEGYKE